MIRTVYNNVLITISVTGADGRKLEWTLTGHAEKPLIITGAMLAVWHANKPDGGHLQGPGYSISPQESQDLHSLMP